MMRTLGSILAVSASAQYTTITDSGLEVPQQSQNSKTTNWVPAPALPQSAQNPPAFNDDQVSALLGESTPGLKSPFAGSKQPTKFDNAELTQDTEQVVRGLVEAFMHKVTLVPGERQCLINNMATFAGDMVGTVGDAATGIKALVKGKGSIAKGQSGSVMGAGIDGATKLMSLVTLSTTVLKNCVRADAIDMMQKSARHMSNAAYFGDRIMVNGVDIARALSDAIIAVDMKRWHRFGTDIGVALRKVMLSKAKAGDKKYLPEGVPNKVIIQKATQGLMNGFFVSGSSVDVSDAVAPNLHLHVDLHRCISGNEIFFKEVWMGAWDLFAQMSANGLDIAHRNGQPQWQGELMVAMAQLPLALQKCGVSLNMQHMLTDALSSPQDLHFQMHMPGHPITAREASTEFAKAVRAWTRWDFETFGFELGKVFREMLMLAFPQKYSVNEFGELHEKRPVLVAGEKVAKTFVPVIAGAVVFMAVFFRAARALRAHPVPAADSDELPLVDVELPGIVDVVE